MAKALLCHVRMAFEVNIFVNYAREEEFGTIINVLQMYETISGHEVNYDKTIVSFSRGEVLRSGIVWQMSYELVLLMFMTYISVCQRMVFIRR